MFFLQLLQQKILKRLFVGQLQHIGRNEEVVIHAGERVLHHLLALACAEQDADRRVVARLHFVLAIMRYVCVELSEVLVGELLVLQFYDYAAMQNAVVEHKVGIIQQLCSILRPILAMLYKRKHQVLTSQCKNIDI